MGPHPKIGVGANPTLKRDCAKVRITLPALQASSRAEASWAEMMVLMSKNMVGVKMLLSEKYKCERREQNNAR